MVSNSATVDAAVILQGRRTSYFEIDHFEHNGTRSVVFNCSQILHLCQGNRRKPSLPGYRIKSVWALIPNLTFVIFLMTPKPRDPLFCCVPRSLWSWRSLSQHPQGGLRTALPDAVLLICRIFIHAFPPALFVLFDSEKSNSFRMFEGEICICGQCLL